MNPITCTTTFILLLAAGSATAQTAFVLNRDPGSGLKPAFGANLPGPVFPSGFGLVQEFLRPDLPNYYAGSIAATGTPLPPVAHEGDITIDQEARLVYTTDGTSFLAQDGHSIYGVIPTAANVALPLPGWAGGPLTGLAVSSSAGLLYICDGAMCQPRSKLHPYPAAAPAFPIPPFLGAPGATGLEWDAATGTLWACNVAGATVNFTTTGALVGAFPAPPVPGLAPVRGIAINPMAGPFAMPPLVPQDPGFHICLTNGSIICDAMPPFATLALSTSFGTHCRGIAISADPVLLPGQWVPGSPGFHRFNNDPILNPGPGYLYPQIGLTRPSAALLSSTCDITLDGGPVLSPVKWIANVHTLGPTGGGVIIVDDVLWMSPFTLFLMGDIVTDSAGHAQFTLPLGLLPIGFHFVLQWAIPDPGAYFGADLSDALLFRIGLN